MNYHDLSDAAYWPDEPDNSWQDIGMCGCPESEAVSIDNRFVFWCPKCRRAYRLDLG